MRIYRVDLLLEDDRKMEYFMTEAVAVRSFLAQLYHDRDVEILGTYATPEFDEWQQVDIK